MCLGIPGRVVALVDEAKRLAIVDVAGVRRAVNIAFIVDAEHPPSECLDTWVLVHVGFAMSRIDEAEAARTLQLLEELGDVQAELEASSRATRTGEEPSQ
jgi:hydrogenase expression/formation protein HypC